MTKIASQGYLSNRALGSMLYTVPPWLQSMDWENYSFTASPIFASEFG